MSCRVVVLISGSGSNLQALIEQLDSPAEIVGVIANRPQAYGLQRATVAGIANECLDHQGFSSREAFDQALAERIDSYQPDLVVLAGFMRILTPELVRRYHGRMLNIHPSLLPKYKGLHTHQRALDAGDAEHGATIHFVTEELDGGPLVVQGRVKVIADDSAETLAARVQLIEHRLYPLAVSWFAQGRLRLASQGAELDGELIASGGLRMEDYPQTSEA
ncbi:MAG: phosphoribosylglycinamide formyltransferase [Pseudomonadaceae bacterium]|nr:MAG: phosphoribosylglycinamide formyltransferase [Pseudomonadaceae bacterium]